MTGFFREKSAQETGYHVASHGQVARSCCKDHCSGDFYMSLSTVCPSDRASVHYQVIVIHRESLELGSNWSVIKVICDQPAPKYHTKGCSHSSADSPGARTLVFAAFEPFHSCEFRASIARTPFCAILWRSPHATRRSRKQSPLLLSTLLIQVQQFLRITGIG